ncbi:retrovirus-related pol polyprotein from transposon TNT 1-94 [Tanacetum coccineum]
MNSKVVNFTKCQNLRMQVKKLKSENDGLKISVEELPKAREIVEVTLRKRDEMVSARNSFEALNADNSIAEDVDLGDKTLFLEIDYLIFNDKKWVVESNDMCNQETEPCGKQMTVLTNELHEDKLLMLKEKKQKVEDALNAIKLHFRSSFRLSLRKVLVGGGCTLLRLAVKVDNIKETLGNDEPEVGSDIVKRALGYPMRLIAKNVVEYGVSTSIGYGVSSSLSNTAYSIQLINTAYPLPLDTAYRLSCMTRRSTNELYTPYKDPECEFRSSRRHFKTLSLDELRSPDFNLLSDEEYSEEEEEEMVEIMEQYMSKTRTDYGSRVARPKIDSKDQFELKGQFLKELRENTFSGSDNEDANEHIEKVLEIVDLFHVPNITVDQLMLRVFPISLTGAATRWLRNEPTGSIKTWEDLKTKFLNKYCPPGRTAKKMEEINNFQQEPDETLYQAWERFKELLMKCPQHYLTEMQEVILFYNGLDVPT